MAKCAHNPVRLRHIAQRADVSLATVSMALANHAHINEQTRQRLRQIARDMGYRTPRRKAATKPARFGFVLLGSKLEDELHREVYDALTAPAQAMGLELKVLAIPDLSSAQAVIENVQSFAANLDGLVLTGYVDAPLLSELDAAQIPHVLLGHAMVDSATMDSRYCQVVTSDEAAMGMLATHRLIAAGHQRIAFVCERIPRGLWAERWLRGYNTALIEHGMKLDPELVQITGKVYGGAATAVEALLKLRKPATAYIAPDIRVGASVLQSLKSQGVTPVPGSIVISGHEQLITHYRMQDWPWIGYPFKTLASVVIRQLHHLHREPMPCITEVIVPYASRNLPGNR